MTNQQSAKEQILTRIRSGLQQAHLPSAAIAIPPRPAPTTSAPRDQLAAQFTQELTALAGEVHQPKNDADAIAIILNEIRASGVMQALAWHASELPLRGLSEALQVAGVQLRDEHLSADGETRKAQLQTLDAPLVGITRAQGGLADTGSVALISAPTRPRAASLLPLLHIVLLPMSRLYADMASFVAAHSRETLLSGSNLIYITGPSRTADIEMTLTRGVHGPKRICVILLAD
jgi:L-lactate dehydrogenase complex protein LldG